MKVTVLIDNAEHENLVGEWGLSLLIETEAQTVLLDAGASDQFATNAKELGVDLGSVDFAVLSHAHFDHANGLDAFFEVNGHAPCYIQESCEENCYAKKEDELEYIGIKRGILADYQDRLIRIGERKELAPGVHLLGHDSSNMAEVGKQSRMFTMENEELQPEEFTHEQSLVIETENGLAVFNSCTHCGPKNLIEEVNRAFPGKPIIAIVGGLHSFQMNDEQVREMAQLLKAAGLKDLYTGHCTGERALELLAEDESAYQVHQFHSGLVFEI